MLYNIYRPTDFSEVKGQEDVLLTVKKQSQTGNFGHAYLLAGHRGTGKTTIARILSRAANCDHPSENGPCNVCASCLAAKESLDIFELDAASNNGVDKIKEMMAQTKYQPVQLRKKVFIIDEVHNLSAAAFDVLLKPLEEPPAYCMFILCTTELHKIPVTVRSRCEEYVFHPISSVPMKARLKEVLNDQNAICDEDSLNLIVRNANGGLRDALGLLEQLIVSTNGNITSDVTKKRLGALDADQILDSLEYVIALKPVNVLDTLDGLLQSGSSPSLIIETTLNVLSDMITLKSTQSKESIIHSQEYVKRLWNLIPRVSFERLYWMCEQYCQLRSIIRSSINPALDIRLLLIRMSSHDIVSADPIALAEEVAALKREVTKLKQVHISKIELDSAQNTASIGETLQENNNASIKEDLLQTSQSISGFADFNQDELDIPFGASELSPAPNMPSYETSNTKLQKEEVMQTNRAEEDTCLSHNVPETLSAADISSSELFKIFS